MAALRSNLQKSLFDDERLIAVCHVLKVDNKKKKKDTYLCLTVTLEQPISVRLYVVKGQHDELMRKKERYTLRDVRIVDGINPRKPIPELKMSVADKTFHLVTGTHEEKESFIRQLYKLSNNYLPVQKPEFVNVSLPVDVLMPAATDAIEHVEEVPEEYNDYQIGEANKFAAVLNEQLMQLDGANIQSIMGSEQAVTELIELFDAAIEEAETLENQLDNFDQILSFVRDSVELIEERDSLGHIERTNTRKLMQELADFVYLMDTVTDEHIQVLRMANLSDPTSINRCCQSARAVNNFLSKKTQLNSMAAYQERMEVLHTITDDFVDKLYSHVIALFDNMEAMLESQSWGGLIMQKQSQRHHALQPFSDLIHWLKVARPPVYASVLERYKGAAQLLYRKEFDRFFSVLSKEARDARAGGMSDDHLRKKYTDLLDTAVAESRTLVETEQKFATRFFHINAEVLANLETQSSGSGEGSLGGKSLEKQLNDQVRSVVAPMFDSMPQHVQRFCVLCGEQYPLSILSMFVSHTRKLSVYQDTSSYFSVLYGSILVSLKRLFDDQMKAVEAGYSNVRLTKRTRIGVLDTIEHFQALARTADLIFGDSERRNDLEKWLEKLTDALVMGINMAAESPNSKSPAAVVRFENFHQLWQALSELKLECLDARRKNIKKMYQENIQAYVHEYMGQPLEKIHTFFEQVQRSIDAGTRPEEVGFQQQFSRMELKRVISAYPAKEVKKGLENLYKKVEKHLVAQSPLLQVVWRDMQDEFLKQLKHYQQLIGRCYPTSRIDLEVSVQDVLQFFSEIAQQH
ncbi:putative exocyst complex component Sec3 [Aphelenchoides avenae]|nr:putative exocyst complex component Sec3 [Aphelenchus avenae]